VSAREVAASVPERLVTMGRVLGAHGVRGALMVASFCEPAARLLKYPNWWLRRGDSLTAAVLLRGTDATKGLIVELDGIVDRDAAAALKGVEIAIDRSLLPPLRKGQYYWADLEQMRVINQDEVDFGRVDHLFDSGAHPILVVSDGQRERLIPFVLDHHVLSVDLDSGVIRVDWDADF
jgi:16S rRNA processing protein RimM